MAVVKQLNVTRFVQEPGLCGAATAQMILFYKNLVGGQPADQDALWTEIQKHTNGGRPKSPPAVIQDTVCPIWKMQQCDQCQGKGPFMPWCTYPPALQATLAYYVPPMLLTVAATDQILTGLALASVDFDIPPAVLVQFGLHWIVVSGYETDGNNPQPIGGRMISEIYVCDPDPNASNHSVAIDVWMAEYSSPVNQCSFYQNKLVVIAANGPFVLPIHVTPPPKRPHRYAKKPPRPSNPRQRRKAVRR